MPLKLSAWNYYLIILDNATTLYLPGVVLIVWFTAENIKMDTLKLLFKVNRDALNEKLKLLADYGENPLHLDLISRVNAHNVILKLEQEIEVCRAAINRLAGMGIPRRRTV